MKPYYYFENNNIHIMYMPDNGVMKVEDQIIYNAIPYLQYEVGIPFIEIQDDKIIIHE